MSWGVKTSVAQGNPFNFQRILLASWAKCKPVLPVPPRFKLVTQSAITCSKLTIETLRQGAKYVQS